MNEVQQYIDEFAALMKEHNIVKMEYTSDELSFCFSKEKVKSKVVQEITNEPVGKFVQSVFETSEEINLPQGEPILSPLTGIFYATSDPDSPPFVSLGEKISQGQVIGLVEAMKVFNEILAPHSGTVSEYCVQHGQLVQYNEPIIYISTST